jgi:predicted nucleotidyltransferase
MDTGCTPLRTEVAVLSVDVERMARRLARVGGVVGVCLGGSRARGTHHPGSDVDLGLYYRPPLDTAALRRLAAEITGQEVEVTEPGGWGPWVDGGAWLRVGGVAVDWIYRDLDRVRTIWDECRRGRFEIGVQLGHPLGVYSHAYAGELALGRVLADPHGELAGLRRAMRVYPPPLREALVGAAQREAPFMVAVARKGAARGDACYVAGCLFQVAGLLAHALHAAAGVWLVNEKGAVAAAGALPAAPPGFADRAHGLFTALGPGPDRLAAALDDAEALTAEVVEGLRG